MSDVQSPAPARPAAPSTTVERAETATPAARLRTVIDDSYDFLWRSLRRLGVPEASVEDAAQQVFVVLARRVDEVPVGSERAFLFGVAVRVASDARRTVRRRREDVTADGFESIAHPGLSPEEIADVRAARDLLDRALDALPDEQRAVFVLYELEELTMAEAAEMLQIPHGPAASRLRRARDLFKTTMTRLVAQPSTRAKLGGER